MLERSREQRVIVKNWRNSSRVKPIALVIQGERFYCSRILRRKIKIWLCSFLAEKIYLWFFQSKLYILNFLIDQTCFIFTLFLQCYHVGLFCLLRLFVENSVQARDFNIISTQFDLALLVV